VLLSKGGVKMNGIVKPLYELDEFKRLISNIDRGVSPVTIHGLSESQKSHMVYSIFDHIKRPVIFVTYNDIEAKNIYDDLSFFMDNVYYLPSREILFYDTLATSFDIAAERLKVLKSVIELQDLILITSIDNLTQKYIKPSIYNKYSKVLEVGQVIDIGELLNLFIVSGYERVDTVEGKGQFSIRGGIIDFYPLVSKEPYRIELFDDEIDSIREFDIYSQRSTYKVDKATIFPVREIIIERDSVDRAVDKIKRELDLSLKSKKVKSDKERLVHLNEKFSGYITKLKETIYFEGTDGLLPYFYDEYFTLIDYFKTRPYVMLDEPSRIYQKADSIFYEFQQSYESMLQKGEVLPSQGELLYSKSEVFSSLLDNKVITYNTLPRPVQGIKPLAIATFSAITAHSFHGQMELLTEDLMFWKSKSYRIVILSGTEAKGKRLVESLRDQDIEALYLDSIPEDIPKGQIAVTMGSLNKGFEYPEIGFVVVSDKEIFGESKRKRRPAPKKGLSKIKNFTDLKVGDYVVHVNHGIGIYKGIEQLVVDGIKKDYLDIRYASGDKLFVPVDQLDMIQKYIGGEGKAPKVYKLGGTEWIKAKKKVKESVREMADDLVKLYAERQQVKGHQYPPDTPWQKQFEDEFLYEETPDQLTAAEEIKEDMESPKPMDRLLCGDVGYGKTEVAVRAAFKAAMDGKQVAFLVPTTILADQHYNNFKKRFADFPINIDMISRFRSQAEQKQTIKALKSGTVDILVGTHRLLQKDIVFKNLGLLIIDEEQRFGVAHKEAIKSLKRNVDVLTLSATPIPRTLHMSLLGVRDMSVIETPPEERYPVQTYVVEFNEELIRDAISREIGRGGQIYFVYNRVETIEEMRLRLNALVPEARIAIGHGQMSERQLENVMIDFLQREYDILLSTTIIENGIDIPNVNTLIVYDADKMGLSQLYQLRGRVGRSNRLAYAYFTYKKDKVLTEIAEKRLKAIKEFTEFGSGFKIAMRDLEIRGAGNILGPQQHGHMDAVGYDMYCRLLEEAVLEVKGEEREEPVETTIDLTMNAYIDSDFIKDSGTKIEMYKKIAAVSDLQDMYDLQEEIEDRFGDIPPAMDNLLKIAYIKALASKINVASINQKGNKIEVTFADNRANKKGSSGSAFISQDGVLEFMKQYGKVVNFNMQKPQAFIINVPGYKEDQILRLLKDMFVFINSLQ
jgi:transcription-repair coupling factor (superfamily II helicase)